MRRNCAAKTEEEQHDQPDDPPNETPAGACLPRLRRAAPSRPRTLHQLQTEGRTMTGNAAENAKTGPRTREQPDPAYEDAEVSECRAGPVESRTEPAGATEILRLITHGRCECDLCTNRQRAKEAAK